MQAEKSILGLFVRSLTKCAPVPGSAFEADNHPREQEQGVSGAAAYPST